MEVIGFFSGVGGIEEGFRQAGFNPLWANEIDEKVAKVFASNHNCKIVVDDIKNLNIKDIPEATGIVAGFPCQAFSVAGYQKGFKDDRGIVFFYLADIIKKKISSSKRTVISLEYFSSYLLSTNFVNNTKPIKYTNNIVELSLKI